MPLWKKSVSKDNSGKKWGQKNLFLLFSLEIVSIAILIVLLVFGADNPLSVPMVVIFGVVAFLGILTLAAAVLDFYDLSDKCEALGLPSGSVRALIALSLILIFAIMVIFMALNLGVKEQTFPGSSNIIYGDKNITSSSGGNITILIEPSQAAVDFSKQVLTTISTLVVALAGFYFGTRSVAQAQKSTESPEVTISISPPSPKTLNITGNPDEDKVVITVTTRPENELIMFKVTNDLTETVKRSETNPSEFTYTPSNKVKQAKPQTAVTLEFWMLKYPGDKEELIIIIVPKP